MASRSRSKDLYPNRAVETIGQTAANTIAFEQIRFGLGVFQGVALVIHRVEFNPYIADIRELVDVADDLEVALTNRDDLTTLIPNNLNVLIYRNVTPMMVGAVVSLTLERFPIVVDLSNLPGGGLIIPANPLYIGIDSTGYATTVGLNVTIYFTFKQLSDADYIELVQGMLPANI